MSGIPKRSARAPMALRSVLAVLVAGGLAACSATTDKTTDKTDGDTTGERSDSTAPSTAPTTEPAAEASPAIETPTAEWERVDAAAAGFDKAKLDALAKQAEASGTTCLLVTKDGKLVADYYLNGAGEHDSQEVWSATKSVSSTIVGIAQAQGLLTIDDPARKYIPEWSEGDAALVTVKDLLSNDSGRHYDFETDYQKMAIVAPDKTQFAIDLPQDAAPGTHWDYNNSAIQTLSEVLAKTVGEDPVDYAAQNLLQPIGMDDSTMTTDSAGNMLTFMGLQSTCPDMARFGLLFLNEGKWGEEQIVPSEWVEEATTPSQDLNRSYGYLWWLNTPSKKQDGGDQATGGTATTSSGPPRRQMVEGAPNDAFFALGLGNQVVSVVPSEGIVAVRLGTGSNRSFGVKELTMGVLDAAGVPASK